jgi:homoserine O-acetyltransferase/O-succinyltransferase
MTSYPKRICSAIPIATTMKHTPQQIAFNEVGRQAIMADPDWQSGNYYDKSIPAKGLSIARMIGHITYMSDVSMAEKFGRKFRSDRTPFKFGADFEVEGYLRNRGDNFVRRFDANSYLYITKAIDFFNILNGHNLSDIFRGLRAKVLVIAFKSDWLYPTYQSQEIMKACKLSGVDSSYCEVNSTYGHDAFLLESNQESQLIGNFLTGIYDNEEQN